MNAPNRAPQSLADVLAWLESAPDGALLPTSTLRAWLAPLAVSDAPGAPVAPVVGTWRERLWTCPPETRLGVVEVAEALGQPRSWVYRRTSERGPHARLPHRKLDGALVFLAGELRAWVEQHAVAVVRPVRWPGSPALSVHKGAA